MDKKKQDPFTAQHFTIYHDFVIKTPVANIFEAVTDPEHLINWWPLKCSGKPQLGETYNFYFTPEYDWLGIKLKTRGSYTD